MAACFNHQSVDTSVKDICHHGHNMASSPEPLLNEAMRTYRCNSDSDQQVSAEISLNQPMALLLGTLRK